MRLKKSLILCILFLLTMCLTILPFNKVVGQIVGFDIFPCMETEIVNDTYYCNQWNLKDTKAGINWESLKEWEDYHKYGEGIVVAIIDTGVKKHKDLDEDNFVPGKDFVLNENIKEYFQSRDSNGHGTGQAGIILQKTNNGYGSAGVAYNAKFMPVRIIDGSSKKCSYVNLETIAKAIKFAATNDADVINLSLGEPENCTKIGKTTQQAISHLKEAIDIADRNGAVVVFAAGNTSNNPIGPISEILKSKKVITVAAHDANGKITDYSNSDVANISAPGGSKKNNTTGILSMIPVTGVGHKSKNYRIESGTSEAAAHVSGVAAIVMSELKSCGNHYKICPEIDKTEIAGVVRDIIIKSADLTDNKPVLNAAKAEWAAWHEIEERTESTSYDANSASEKSNASFLTTLTNPMMQHSELAEKSRADHFMLENKALVFALVILVCLASFFVLKSFPFISGTLIYITSSSVLLNQVKGFDITSYVISEVLLALIPISLVVLLLRKTYWLKFSSGAVFGSVLSLAVFAVVNFYSSRTYHAASCLTLSGLSLAFFLYLNYKLGQERIKLLREIEQLVKEFEALKKNILNLLNTKK